MTAPSVDAAIPSAKSELPGMVGVGDGTEVKFMQAGHALAEAAVRMGLRFYSGYPIRPSSEIQEYLSIRLRELGAGYVSASSEMEAICMVAGAAAAGVPAMIASSSTGISLMQEQLAEAASAGLPLVVVNGCRFVLQADYHQAVKGGGHGDYRMPVLAPSNTQELVDLTQEAFALAWKYRHPALVFTDAFMLSCAETVKFRSRPIVGHGVEDWAITGRRPGQPRNLVTHVVEDPASPTSMLTDTNPEVLRRMTKIEATEALSESFLVEDAEVIITCFGSVTRAARLVVRNLRAAGIKVGLFRPITLWPFPTAALLDSVKNARQLICVELNRGQMIEDVRAALEGRAEVIPLTGNGDIESGFGAMWSPDAITGKVRQTLERTNASRRASGR